MCELVRHLTVVNEISLFYERFLHSQFSIISSWLP